MSLEVTVGVGEGRCPIFRFYISLSSVCYNVHLQRGFGNSLLFDMNSTLLRMFPTVSGMEMDACSSRAVYF
jgi:hypothetical protein